MDDTAVPSSTARFLARKLELPRIARSAWLLDAWLRSGRRLAIAAFAHGELTALPPRDATVRAPTVTLQTAHGALRLRRTQAMEWLCLLAGLPLPATNADEGALRWRAALATTRMPADVRKCWGPLSCNWSDGDDRHGGDAASAEDARQLTLRLTRDDVHCHLDAWASAGTWQRLLAAFDPLPAGHVDWSLACAWRLNVGTCSLSVVELMALEAGDVVRLQHAFDADGVGVLRLGGFVLRLALQTSTHDGARTSWRACVREPARADEDPIPIHADTAPFLENHAMAEESESNTSPSDAVAFRHREDEASQNPVGPGDDLRIELVAELGMLTMTLGELRDLRPGSTVVIRSRGPAEVIVLSAPDSPVAEGFLVDIDGQLGVEVTRRIRQ